MPRALSLTEEQVTEILDDLKSGTPVRRIAAKYGVSHPTILKVRDGKYSKFGNIGITTNLPVVINGKQPMLPDNTLPMLPPPPAHTPNPKAWPPSPLMQHLDCGV